MRFKFDARWFYAGNLQLAIGGGLRLVTAEGLVVEVWSHERCVVVLCTPTPASDRKPVTRSYLTISEFGRHRTHEFDTDDYPELGTAKPGVREESPVVGPSRAVEVPEGVDFGRDSQARREALTAFFLREVFPPGSYRALEFAEGCADALAQRLGATRWDLTPDPVRLCLEVGEPVCVDLQPIVAALRGTSVNMLVDRVQSSLEELLHEARLVLRWEKNVPPLYQPGLPTPAP